MYIFVFSYGIKVLLFHFICTSVTDVQVNIFWEFDSKRLLLPLCSALLFNTLHKIIALCGILFSLHSHKSTTIGTVPLPTTTK